MPYYKVVVVVVDWVAFVDLKKLVHSEEYLLVAVDSVACLQASAVVALEYLDPFAASVHSSVDFHSSEEVVAALAVLVAIYAVAKSN